MFCSKEVYYYSSVIIIFFVFLIIPVVAWLDRYAKFDSDEMAVSSGKLTGSIMIFDSSGSSQSLKRLVAYKRLSSEKEFPFLQEGKPLSERKQYLSKRQFNSYQQAVELWPDVRACLVGDESVKETPNLHLFEWQKLKSTEAAEVCIFRVMSSLGNVEKAKAWFIAQGFEPDNIRIFSKEMMQEHQKVNGPTIHAKWDLKKKGIPNGESFKFKLFL